MTELLNAPRGRYFVTIGTQVDGGDGSAASLPAIDSGSNKLNGTHSNITSTGSEMLYNGTTSKAEITPALLGREWTGINGSVFVRARAEDITANDTYFRITSDSTDYIWMRIEDGTTVRWLIEVGASSSYPTKGSIDPTDYLVIGVGLEDDGSGGTHFDAYLDGVREAGATFAGEQWSGALTDVDIGNSSGSYFLEGAVSGVVIGYTAITDPQALDISTKMNDGTLTAADLDGIYGAGEWSWYKFDEDPNAIFTPDAMGADAVYIRYDGTPASSFNLIGDVIQTWYDSSGNSRDAIQNIGGSQPERGANFARFDGVNDRLVNDESATYYTQDNIMVIAVLARQGDGNFVYNSPISLHEQGGTEAGVTGGLFGYESATGGDITLYRGGAYTGSSINFDALPDGEVYIICQMFTGVDLAVNRLNGTEKSDTAVGDSFNFDRVYLGSRAAGIFSQYDIYDVIIAPYNASLYEKIEGYYAWKHNTLATLDDSHPYKFTHPKLGD